MKVRRCRSASQSGVNSSWLIRSSNAATIASSGGRYSTELPSWRGRSHAKKGFAGSISTGFSSSTSASSHRPLVARHQPHPEKIRELQRGPVAPRSVGIRRTQFFGKGMRQDRLGLGIADAVGQTGKRLETVDGDVMAGGDLRPQAQLPQAIERAMPEGDDVREHASHLVGEDQRIAVIRGATHSRRSKIVARARCAMLRRSPNRRD